MTRDELIEAVAERLRRIPGVSKNVWIDYAHAAVDEVYKSASPIWDDRTFTEEGLLAEWGIPGLTDEERDRFLAALGEDRARDVTADLQAAADAAKRVVEYERKLAACWTALEDLRADLLGVTGARWAGDALTRVMYDEAVPRFAGVQMTQSAPNCPCGHMEADHFCGPPSEHCRKCACRSYEPSAVNPATEMWTGRASASGSFGDVKRRGLRVPGKPC